MAKDELEGDVPSSGRRRDISPSATRLINPVDGQVSEETGVVSAVKETSIVSGRHASSWQRLASRAFC